MLDYANNISRELTRKYWLSYNIADVIFVAKRGEKLPAHKDVLIGHSATVPSLLVASERQDGMYVLCEDCSASSIASMLHFLYAGFLRLDFNLKHVDSIRYLASKYGFKALEHHIWHRFGGYGDPMKSLKASDLASPALNVDRILMYSPLVLSFDDGTVMKASEILLAYRSQYFEAMFQGQWKESSCKTVQLHCIEAERFKKLLEYLFYDRVVLSQVEDLFELVAIATYFRVSSLISACEDAAVRRLLTKESCCSLWIMAEEYGLTDLAEACMRFFENHFSPCSHAPEFLKLSKDQLLRVLSSGNIDCDVEFMIERLHVWIAHHSSSDDDARRLVAELLPPSTLFNVAIRNFVLQVPHRTHPLHTL